MAGAPPMLAGRARSNRTSFLVKKYGSAAARPLPAWLPSAITSPTIPPALRGAQPRWTESLTRPTAANLPRNGATGVVAAGQPRKRSTSCSTEALTRSGARCRQRAVEPVRGGARSLGMSSQDADKAADHDAGRPEPASPLPPAPLPPGGRAALPEGSLPKPFLGPQGDENRDPPPNAPAPVNPTQTVEDIDRKD